MFILFKDRSRVSEDRELRGIFGARREELARGWRRLHDEGLHNFYASPNTIRINKSRTIEGWGI
jgi:hypothetical protein